jgi:hypothetical protein
VAQVASTLAAVAAAKANPKTGKAKRRTKREMGCVSHWGNAGSRVLGAAGLIWECNCADCVLVRGHRVRVHDGPQGRSIYQVDAQTRRVTN